MGIVDNHDVFFPFFPPPKSNGVVLGVWNYNGGRGRGRGRLRVVVMSHVSHIMFFLSLNSNGVVLRVGLGHLWNPEMCL